MRIPRVEGINVQSYTGTGEPLAATSWTTRVAKTSPGWYIAATDDIMNKGWARAQGSNLCESLRMFLNLGFAPVKCDRPTADPKAVLERLQVPGKKNTPHRFSGSTPKGRSLRNVII